MHTLVSDSAHAVFVKTAKGHEEITQRRYGLNTRQRRVLIIMDGTKAVSSIREVIPGDGLDEIISELAKQGFIALASAGERNAVARFEKAVAHEPVRPQDVEKIRQVKDFMTTTATTYLGLLSADVIHRIERAKGAAQLMTVVGHWHMALRESKQGSRFAGPYLEQVTVALTGSSTQSESHPV